MSFSYSDHRFTKVERPNTNSQNFRAGHAPRPNDVFIAVMGVTGSGKSSFISICSGKPVTIGHDLGACTSKVDVYAYDMSPDRTVYLIDTPGFDDTTRSDTEVLSEIAAWFGDSYKNKILLNGIIYLHRITDIRMQGSAKKNLIMFKQLCGPDALKRVILVTSMWDKISNDEAVRREKELIDTPEFWGWMLQKGSSSHRHYNTEASAMEIVSKLASFTTPIATALQTQLVDERRTLDQTSAGRELQSELLKEKKKWDRERREIEEQMKAAIRQRDREAEEMMREERDRYTSMIKKVEKDTGALRLTMESLLAQRDERVERMEKQMREQQLAHERELKQIRESQRKLEREKAEMEKERERERQAQRERDAQRRQRDLEFEKLQREAREQLERISLQEKVKAQAVSAPRQTNQVAQQGRASQQQAIVSNASTYQHSPYCLTLFDGTYGIISPTYWSSNSTYPTQQLGAGWQAAVSFGDVYDGGKMWVCRYSNGTWQSSKGLDRQYPHLGAKISSHGLGNLDLCVLGPGQKYYARFQDGRYSSWASDEINNIITNISSATEGYKIFAMSFGYNDSFVISYGHGSNIKQLGNKWDLKGNYPGLLKLLTENTPLSILAVALNPKNSTDYIIVWTNHHGDGLYRMSWNIENASISQSVLTWWNNTCSK